MMDRTLAGKLPGAVDLADAEDHAAHDPITRLLAWGVHIYTALGLVLAAGIAVLLVRGGADAFRWSFGMMLIATLIDATDGTLARRIRVKAVLPNFDGRKLDDLTDFLTYTFLPLFLIWRAELLPASAQGWLVLPLLASAYGFCQVDAKTEDGFFLGFPSLWNVVAFYLYVLPLGPWTCLVVVLALALLTFVPSKYLYPSQPGRLNLAMTILGVLWTIPLAWLVWSLPVASSPRLDPSLQPLALASLAYPAFYLVASWVITLKHWRRGKLVN